MIQVRGFCPPAEDPPECWPWPIRLRLLGPWSVEIHGVRWTPAHKTPRKPLELLKYLAAGGEAAFEGIAIDRIIEALWPDPEADDPRSSFDIALHRLRKLLTVENAIVAGDGRLRLSAEKVWTDVAEWERAARRIRAGGISAEVAGRMRDLYRGAPFQEESAAWALSRREQLQARFIESVIEAGAALEGAGLYGQARLLYARAAEHESIVEPLYRGMMRCCLAAEEFAEGLRAYRRCREMLSMVLSVAPSSETEVLRNALLAASSFKAPD
jgi:DNA-binding SARP family transcriptional activator